MCLPRVDWGRTGAQLWRAPCLVAACPVLRVLIAARCVSSSAEHFGLVLAVRLE